jgi:hypothetical protein
LHTASIAVVGEPNWADKNTGGFVVEALRADPCAGGALKGLTIWTGTFFLASSRLDVESVAFSTAQAVGLGTQAILARTLAQFALAIQSKVAFRARRNTSSQMCNTEETYTFSIDQVSTDRAGFLAHSVDGSERTIITLCASGSTEACFTASPTELTSPCGIVQITSIWTFLNTLTI